jgi:phage shock protein E
VSRDNLILWALLGAYVVWKLLRSLIARRRVAALRAGGAQVVDVRSHQEFVAGHAQGSINIPLPDLPDRLQELDAARCQVLCCASGARSAVACSQLRRAGYSQVYNAGSWRNCR